MNKIRIGILGPGTIAHRMARTICASENAVLHAAASREKERAERFAEKYHAEKAFSSYQELYEDPDTDLIYISTPHIFHFEQAKQALLHGKHVLCEKPMTINAVQAEELFQIAEERGLFISEAIWTRYLPLAVTLRKRLDSGVIGKPQMMTANYGFPDQESPRMTEPSLAGGALLDIGIYALTAVSMVFGEDIADIKTTANLSEKGVDIRSMTTFTFKGGEMACIMTSLDTVLDSKVVIYGSDGWMEADPVYNWNEIRIYDRTGSIHERISRPRQITGFEYELEAAVRAVQEGKTETPEVPHELILKILRQMDALRAAWGMKYPGE